LTFSENNTIIILLNIYKLRRFSIMKVKKILAGVLACVTVFGILPYSNYVASENTAMIASAEDYTEGIYGNLTYEKYSDHIEITNCDQSATEVVIPSEIEGLPVAVIKWSAFENHTSLTSRKRYINRI